MASFALFCLAFLALSSQQILTNADVVAATCDKTVDKAVCQSTLASKPADLNGVATTALDAAIRQAKDIQAKINELSKSSDKSTQQRMIDCANDYQHAIVELGKTKQAVNSKSYADVNTWVSAVMSAGESCEDGFKELGGGASPLTDMNKKFKSICSIVLSAANQLNGKA